ncbi:hypothetical protein WN48_07093 [Eufriesea mexicana]|uniref:Uncharacterized protein n=1 Tax=Eufriesea mexicana TaxID=516756 RepID=A0A310SX62_9HYME|nr:hypothetical protein WN48_07093 [Eufriesea mexicana]
MHTSKPNSRERQAAKRFSISFSVDRGSERSRREGRAAMDHANHTRTRARTLNESRFTRVSIPPRPFLHCVIVVSSWIAASHRRTGSSVIARVRSFDLEWDRRGAEVDTRSCLDAAQRCWRSGSGGDDDIWGIPCADETFTDKSEPIRDPVRGYEHLDDEDQDDRGGEEGERTWEDFLALGERKRKSSETNCFCTRMGEQRGENETTKIVDDGNGNGLIGILSAWNDSWFTTARPGNHDFLPDYHLQDSSVVRLSSAIEEDIIDCKEAGNTHKAPGMAGTKSVTIHPTLQPPSVRATND